MEVERHVSKLGRAALVKEVRKKIKELDIEYIYYQFVSVTGRIVGKGIPADHWNARRKKAFNWYMGLRPIYTPTGMAIISATALRRPNWSVFPTPKLSCNCRGISACAGVLHLLSQP